MKILNICSRYLTIILLSLSLLILTACQTTAPKDKGVTHITVWHGINPPPNRDVFQKVVDRFNQDHPDIEVESIYAGQLDQQLPKILTAIVGNSPPDILSFNTQITGQLVELGAIRPLDDWLNKSPLKSKIMPKLWGEMELYDHVWSVPMFAGNIGIFYRPTLFKAAGITELPKTWAELRQVAKKLTLDRNSDGYPEQYGMLMPLGKGEWTVFTWFPFLLGADGNLVKDNRPNLVNPGAIAALQFWQNLIKDGSTKFSAPERGYEEDDFIAGRVAMQLTGPWTLIMKSKVDFDVFPVPGNRKQATVFGSNNMFVMKTTPERERASIKFLEYLLSDEFQIEWSIATGFLPININAAASPAYQKLLQQKPVLKVFLQQMNAAGSRPIIPGYSRLSESLGRAIESTMLGESPAKALQKAQEQLNLIWE
ncbi:ABC transporter substrate-binding protein [Planktothrix sp. FACHB-1355]|uniref:ABC transporter substrate-binding protein n=1 Tax=Aerosakkonema funiforme FACHB-1375 TaxID=2949571 RepID=A0A926VI81_9CYAN|nr:MULTISPECIES: ABC transporter substrate-binding protein [Oscillatoriales]MBD2184277.1 ABC transporter substrate-binding protein [Aerosakkonema funiforme FACHB-1375]MBD3560483.1 ABC transporter substrate-binding protein [Planktothrix sp. FACHB-1355]